MAGKFFSNFFGISDEPTAREYYAPEKPATPVPAAPQPVVKQNNKVVAMQKSRQTQVNPGKIALFEPRIYSDVRGIAKQILAGEAVIVNFTQQDPKTAVKTIDFLNGVVFAIDGQIKRIGEQIFLCTPKNYEVSGQSVADLHRD